MTCHQKCDQFKRKFHLPTPIFNFQGIKICMYKYIYILGTQMTRVFVGKGLVLGG